MFRIKLAKINADGPPPEADAVRAMMDSIRAVGLLHPVSLVRDDETRRYVVLAGRTRVAAVRRLGWRVIDASVHARHEVKNEMVEITENVHRREMSGGERAH